MKRGFTLVEMLVSVALFSVVLVVALGALIALSTAARKAEAINSAVNNLGAAVESMTRTLRTGTTYDCGASSSGVSPVPTNCSKGTSIAFIAADGTTVAYCLGGGTTCSTTGTALLRSINGGAWLPITTPEVNVNNFTLLVTGACSNSGLGENCSSPTDTIQPKVMLVISGTVQITATQNTAFHIETSVTQRVYDL